VTPRRRRGIRLPLGLACALLALAARPAGAEEKLVPAQWRPLTDVHGVVYTCDMHGRVQTQYGWLYSGYQINGSGMNIQRQMMTPAGDEYVIEGQTGVLQVQRRFKVDGKIGGVRIVEVLTNTSNAAVGAAVIVWAQLNYRYQAVVSNRGRPVAGSLEKRESGVAGLLTAPVRGAIVYQLCSAKSAVKPTVVNQNNQSLQFHYGVQVPARSTVAIVHGGVILQQAGAPSGAALEALFKPFESRRWTSDLPRETRSVLVNVRASAVGEGGGLPTLEQELEIAPTSQDQLAFSDQTLLQGTAACARLDVTTVHGRVQVPFERVAAIVGKRHASLEPRILLRDGQQLVGAIEAQGLRFEMSSGMAIDLDVAKIDRLVLRSTPSAGTAAAEAADPAGGFLVETFEGNRLRTSKSAASLHVATTWGALSVPFEELRRLHLGDDEQPGYWVELADESRFRAYLGDEPFEMSSDLFGAVSFQPHQVRRIAAIRHERPGKEDDTEELAQPHVVLAGGDLFVGRIDLDALHFLAPGGALPQPPAQIRALHSELEGALPEPGQTLRFRADIWGGGHVTGELRELIVPFETARGTLRVPVRDIVDVLVPSPIVPEVLRTRLQGLIRDLGHPSWETREAASVALADLGELARQMLQEALRETKDPEVERRIRRLLDKL